MCSHALLIDNGFGAPVQHRARRFRVLCSHSFTRCYMSPWTLQRDDCASAKENQNAIKDINQQLKAKLKEARTLEKRLASLEQRVDGQRQEFRKSLAVCCFHIILYYYYHYYYFVVPISCYFLFCEQKNFSFFRSTFSICLYAIYVSDLLPRHPSIWPHCTP